MECKNYREEIYYKKKKHKKEGFLFGFTERKFKK
jgi:hypothetical protein